MAYLGQTRSRKLIERLNAAGYGEMTVRGELPPRRLPYAFDNGAYRDWKAGRPFDVATYRADLARIAAGEVPRPDFIVVPDIVAGGLESLAYSLTWVDEIAALAPAYLAVQDGMSEADVRAVAHRFAGLFVGGSRPWKIATGGGWVTLAHELGMPCHIGRAGGSKTAAWALRIGADTIDSCLPLWGEDNLARFQTALAARQGELFR